VEIDNKPKSLTSIEKSTKILQIEKHKRNEREVMR
jgi:hypothetical protein